MLAAKRKSMSETKASRTLVKSTPELWSEVSNAASLQRHMDQFGEIRITKLEPESAVAWEGEQTRGTITLEASGWGTKVSLTAERVGSGGVDGIEREAAGQAAAGTPRDRVAPASPERVVAPAPLERLVAPASPERVVAPASPERRVAPGPPERVVAPASPERVDPPHEIKGEMRDRTIPPERDWLDAPTQRSPWTRRLAHTLRRWFGPPPPQDSDPLAPAPAEPVPSEPVQASEPVPSEPVQPLPTLAPAAAVAAVRPPPPPEPPLEPVTAPTAALDAALDSLGQAHHRPYSRA